ncbi:hypothetical protein [Nocardia paucivorans]|uniref:hypothetical protein n=1 Tax=Nocardia paucivorans TaxID=114259 RepID=UPI00031D458F|nr:hypothetical protein [Nocardia paucivorans]
MATLGYHVLTDEWLVIPWECCYPGRLTEAEARNVLATHGQHSPKRCRIARTARRIVRAAEESIQKSAETSAV